MIVDTHVHVIDPQTFPIPAGPGYKPTALDVGTAEDLGRVFARHEVGNAVIVQLSGYGTDNSCIIDAVARSIGAWRAIVSLEPDVSDRELDRLQQAGAVGVRFNVRNLGRNALKQQACLLDAMYERQWIAQVQASASDLPELAEWLGKVRVPLVFDHLGLPNVAAGTSDPGFQQLLAFGRNGAFIKLSGAFRVSRQSFPYADLDPYIDAIRDAFPLNRRIWGSDWPFTGFVQKPDYAQTLAMLDRWLPTEEERRLARGETPRRLFGF